MTSPDVHEPLNTELPDCVNASTANSIAAPAARRSVEKEAASIIARPKARRDRTELPANAASAADVQTIVRLSSFIRASSSRSPVSEPRQRCVALLEDLHGEQSTGASAPNCRATPNVTG